MHAIDSQHISLTYKPHGRECITGNARENEKSNTHVNDSIVAVQQERVYYWGKPEQALHRQACLYIYIIRSKKESLKIKKVLEMACHSPPLKRAKKQGVFAITKPRSHAITKCRI